MSIRRLEETRVEAGSIAFTWFNDYAGVAIKTPTRILVIDPVGISPDEFTRVDTIIITHDHYDHLDRKIVRDIQRNTDCIVIADKTSMRILSGVIPSDKLREARIGEAVVVGQVMVNAEESFHPPATTPLSFIITSEQDIKVFHTSDSLPFPRIRDLGQRYKPDITFCTVAIAPGASPRTGVEIAKLVQPRLAIPYHGDKKACEEFASILGREAPNIACKVIEKNEVYLYP